MLAFLGISIKSLVKGVNSMLGFMFFLVGVECIIIFRVLNELKTRVDVLEDGYSFLSKSLGSSSSDDLSDCPAVDDFAASVESSTESE